MNAPYIAPSILTFTGELFDYTTGKNVVQIDDIAHALANICRYGGHCREFYSVAQHCVLASYIVPKQDALWALMHDAAEAYVGDIPRPLKELLPDFRVIEKRVEREIWELFGLQGEMPPSVKHADLVMLATERRDIMAPHPAAWELIDGVAPLKETIEPWPPYKAKHAFVVRFGDIVMQQCGRAE
jgi:hypothetical protein